MSLALAIADLIAAAKTVNNLTVVEEVQEKSRANYLLTITQGTRTRDNRFGASRVTQILDLILDIKKPNPSEVAGIISSIEAALTADRRRDGNAQTTTNPGEWTKAIDEGREGQRMESTIGVVVYED